MIKHKKFMVLSLTGALMISNAGMAQEMDKTVIIDGDTAVKITGADTANDAADSIKITRTTYSYDVNNNNIIEPNEFTTYVTRTLDSNNDGYIVTDEYDGDSMTYFYTNVDTQPNSDMEVKSYSYWDKDQDDRLDSSEIESLVANMGIYKKWDTDMNGTIDKVEFATGTFMVYDDNNDKSISAEEWVDVVM